MFSLGGFNLTKWTSNSIQFLLSVEKEQLGDKDSRNTDTRPLERVLGVKWKPDSGKFLVKQNKLQTLRKVDITQRKLLKLASSLFDSLGITMPLTICLRRSLQLAWTSGPKWDKGLDITILSNLNDWIDEIEYFNNVELPRTYFRPQMKATDIQLHVFSDASELALAAVAYLRIACNNNTLDLKFVMGKARVSPIKRMTIPYLELQAAKNWAKLAKFVNEQHDITINNLKLWTDSTTVLHWINTPNQRHRIFIANSLNLILDTTLHLGWRYVPSKDNPADDATRGYRASDMTSSSWWFTWPAFLLSPSTDWPTQPTLQQSTAVLTTDDTPMQPSPIIDFSRYSNWTKTLKVTT